MSESKILPNSFNTPNIHVDDVMHLLTGDEYKVLNFITRHILGWRDHFLEGKATISLTMITDGYRSKKTGKYFHGVGLSRPTVVKILDALVTYDLIEPIGFPTPKGQAWGLGLYPNMELLQTRFREKNEESEKRMQKVRKVTSKSDEPVNAINQAELMSFTEPSQSHLRKQRHLERQSSKTKEKEITTSAPAIANAGPALNPDEKDVRYPFVEERLSSPPLMGKQIPATAEKVKTGNAGKKTPPPPAPSPAPVEIDQPAMAADAVLKGPKGKGRKPNRTAQIIDGVWGKGVSGGLLPMLMGHAKKAPWKDHNIEGGMTEIEIFAFGRWYKRQNPGLSLPEIAYKVEAAIESFRNATDYDGWMAEGERYIDAYFPRETPPPPKVEEKATPEEIEAFKRQIADGGMNDVFGDLFDEYVSQEKIS